jgi:4-amino-4-deoxychorismate lyase
MSPPIALYLDGQKADADWPLDRGIQYGDGLFETMIARAGRIRFESLHRRRFETGCGKLSLAVAQSPLWDQIAEVARQQGDAVVKLLVTRGPASVRGYGITGNEACRSILYIYPRPDSTDIPDLATAVTLRATLGDNPLLAGIKHCNRLEQVLARIELRSTGAYEGLMASGSGRLISGTMSNVFLDTESGLVTPVLDQCGVAGIMRAVVLREASAMGLPVRVADISMSALDSCRGLFLTNARLGVLPVRRINDRAVHHSDAVHALAQRVATLEN